MKKEGLDPMKSYFYGFRSSRPTPQYILLSLAWSQVKRRSTPEANRKPVQFNNCTWAHRNYKSVINSWVNQLLDSQGQHLLLMYDEIPYSGKYNIYDVWNYQESQRKTLRVIWRLKYLCWKLLFNTRHFGIILTSILKGISTLDIPECLKQHSNYT